MIQGPTHGPLNPHTNLKKGSHWDNPSLIMKMFNP